MRHGLRQRCESISRTASNVEHGVYFEFCYEFQQLFALASMDRAESLHVAPFSSPKLIVFFVV